MTADTVRYFLLESLRLFAAERLAERSHRALDEPARLARRRYYYREKVRAPASPMVRSRRRTAGLDIGGVAEHPRAIDTSVEAGEPVMGLQICAYCCASRIVLHRLSVGDPQSSSRRWQPPRQLNPSGPNLRWPLWP